VTAASVLRRHGSIEPTGRGVVIGALHPAYSSGRSIFPSRVFDPDEVQRVLKTGHQSRKIGAFVDKGRRKGWPIFTLTLEERATCPRTCAVYGACFGNNMQAAERIVAGLDLEEALWNELAELQAKHPAGFMVRLHVLGDFYSEGYVAHWAAALDRFPALHVFGFTARLPGTPIGDALWQLVGSRFDRFAVRFSGMRGELMASQIEGLNDDPTAILCPAQTGATDCCATCALCWHSDRSISFRRH
jgi:hypothetical protein